VPVSTATGWRRSSPTHYPDGVPLDTLITGRIATLSGDDGFGWVEAIGIRDGRVAFAGSEVYLETRADPFTERIALEPDEVAIPGLTDAHLHLARVAAATRQIDLTDASTLADGLEHPRRPGARRSDGGSGGTAGVRGSLGPRPTAGRLEPRPASLWLWAHDHHALLVSHAGFRPPVTRTRPLGGSSAGRTTASPKACCWIGHPAVASSIPPWSRPTWSGAHPVSNC
jgi:predicted amidohydrolase YtcJ